MSQKNALDRLPDWTNFIGRTLKHVNGLGPAEAGKYIDAQRRNIEHSLELEFADLERGGDHIAPLLMERGNQLLAQLPSNAGSFDQLNEIRRILYMIGKQAEQIRSFLILAKITETTSQIVPMKLREGQQFEVGIKDQAGKLASMVLDYAYTFYSLTGNEIDIPRLIRRMRLNDIRVVCNGMTEKEQVDGVYTFCDVTQTGILESVSVGSFTMSLNKKELGIHEGKVRIVAWDSTKARSVPMAICKDTARNVRYDVVTLPEDFTEGIPQKQVT